MAARRLGGMAEAVTVIVFQPNAEWNWAMHSCIPMAAAFLVAAITAPPAATQLNGDKKAISSVENTIERLGGAEESM